MPAKTRDSIRSAILSSESKRRKSKVLPFFGQDIEIRQPSVGDMMKFSEGNKSFIQVLIDFAFVPGTNEKVFEATDKAALEELPFNEDVQAVLDAVTELTSASVKDAEKNSSEIH